MNLIPQRTERPVSYFCTWGAQWRYGAERARARLEKPGGKNIAAEARNMLNEEALFSNPGLVSLLPSDIRGDLFFLIDDGWDVVSDYDFSDGRIPFGSLIVDETRFPSCTGTPAERLAALNTRVKQAGWHGLGIWVAAQAAGESPQAPLDEAETRAYFRERVLWSREADVRYWKIDWGARMKDLRWHEIVGEIAEAEFPDLIVEHAWGTRNVNQDGEVFSVGRFPEWEEGLIAERSAALAARSDVFRTYDYKGEVELPITLDRVAYLLSNMSATSHHRRLINCESVPHVAVGLGCSLGIMGGSQPGDGQDLLKRAIRWQRIAPPFGVGSDESVTTSEIVNVDWFERDGAKIRQGAPAVVTRNLSSLEIDAEEELPYVTATRGPNGCIALACGPRAKGGAFPTPTVDIRVAGVIPGKPVALFGAFRQVELSILASAAPSGSRLRVTAQDLLSDDAVDITDLLSAGTRDRFRLTARYEDLLARCGGPGRPGDSGKAKSDKLGDGPQSSSRGPREPSPSAGWIVLIHD